MALFIRVNGMLKVLTERVRLSGTMEINGLQHSLTETLFPVSLNMEMAQNTRADLTRMALTVADVPLIPIG